MAEEIKQLDKAGLAHLWEKFKENNNVFSNTTAGWAEQASLIAQQGAIQIYTDYRKNERNEPIAAFKVGDGTSYLIDMPFTDELIWDHIENNEIHVSSADRLFWNNKVRCYIDPGDADKLIFTKN